MTTTVVIEELTKHDGPGNHDSGSPQSVHGGGDGGAGALIDDPEGYVNDPANAILPSAIENKLDGGPGTSIQWHGTSTKIKAGDKLTGDHVYITPQPSEAKGYAFGNHRMENNPSGYLLNVRRKPGKTLNISDAIMDGFDNGVDPDEVIESLFPAARAAGFRYMYHEHPSFGENEVQHAIISLYPGDDLKVLYSKRVVQKALDAGDLAKHDGPGAHDSGSPQSVHGGGDGGAGARDLPPGTDPDAWESTIIIDPADIDIEAALEETQSWEPLRAEIAQSALGSLEWMEGGSTVGMAIYSDGGLKAIASFEVQPGANFGKHITDKSMVYIEYLATAEKGYGRESMQNIVNFASEEGCGIYLHSIEESELYYDKLCMHKKGSGAFASHWWTAAEVKELATGKIKKAARAGVPDVEEPEGGIVVVPADYELPEAGDLTKASPLPPGFWEEESRRLAMILVSHLTALALEGMRTGAGKVGVGFNYAIYSILAAQWAQDYTDQLLKQVRTTNEAVVGDLLAEWIATPGRTIGDLRAALTPHFGVRRADTIAITEATRALASGEIMAFQKAGIEEIRWGTNNDELVCPYCGPLHGVVKRMGDPFGYFTWRKGTTPEPVFSPPYHPNCRCGVSPVVRLRRVAFAAAPNSLIVSATLAMIRPAWGAGDLAKHDGPGNHDSGSPQSVHGGEGAGPARSSYEADFINKHPVLYHITSKGQRDSILRSGIRQSKDGMSGRGAYLAISPGQTEYYETVDTGEMVIVNTRMLVDKYGLYHYKSNPSGKIEFDEDEGEVVVRGSVPPEFLSAWDAGDLAKHLPGKHDQQAHGNRGGGTVPYLGDKNDEKRIPYVDPTGNVSFMIAEQMKTLPELHMDGIAGVGFEEGRFVDDAAYGTYEPQSRRIMIASNADNIKVIGGATIIHEVGHHVHLSKMTDAGADEWMRISGNGQNARISAYARTCRGEHFAECYRAYMRGGEHRKRLKQLEPESYKFMAAVAKGKWLLPDGELFPPTSWVKRYKD